MKQLEKIFKALANRRRLAIIGYLKEAKEAPVTEIAKVIKLSFKSTSKHLAVLAAADIVEKESRSLQAYYYIPAKPLELIKHLISVI